MGGPILSHADAVVGEHEDHRLSHHRRQPNGRAHVVGEDQKGASVGDDPPVEGKAIEDGSHRVLPDAEVDVPSTGLLFAKIGITPQISPVGPAEIG